MASRAAGCCRRGPSPPRDRIAQRDDPPRGRNANALGWGHADRHGRILQPGVGPLPGDHYLRSTPADRAVGAAALRDGCRRPANRARRDGHDRHGEPRGHPRRSRQGPARRTSPATAWMRHPCWRTPSRSPATLSRDPAADGPHVVTGPDHVEGAEPGDLLRITVETLVPRVPYGVISNRHGKGALAGELPRGDFITSASSRPSRSATVDWSACFRSSTTASAWWPSRCRPSSARWESRSPATSARTRCRPERTAATSTSTSSSRARRSTCRCRSPARSRTSAIRTSLRATAKSR